MTVYHNNDVCMNKWMNPCNYFGINEKRKLENNFPEQWWDCSGFFYYRQKNRKEKILYSW